MGLRITMRSTAFALNLHNKRIVSHILMLVNASFQYSQAWMSSQGVRSLHRKTAPDPVHDGKKKFRVLSYTKSTELNRDGPPSLFNGGSLMAVAILRRPRSAAG